MVAELARRPAHRPRRLWPEVVTMPRSLPVTRSQPFQRLDDRLAGRPIKETLHGGVPSWLEPSLKDWLATELDERIAERKRLAERVSLRLQLEPHTQGRRTVTHADRLIEYMTGDDRIVVVDAVLQLHHGWEEGDSTDARRFAARIVRLDSILSDGASAYRVDVDSECLVRRVDPTVEQAVNRAIASADVAAADHLRQAWVATYGLMPDPDKAYSEAVRAVEEVACPLVEDRRAEKNLATLGTVLGELRGNSNHKWELALPGTDGAPRNVDHLVGVMEMLWQSQVSRHGGSTKSRRQDQSEAEAAVQLAVLLVQWLATGVLRRKS